MNECTIGLILLYMSLFAGIIFVMSGGTLVVLLLKHKSKRKIILIAVTALIFMLCFGILGNKLWHSWEVKQTIEATCTKNGVIEYECVKCLTVKSENIAKIGHDWISNNEMDATCDHSGFIDYECARCNEEKTKKLKALGHDWLEATCEEPKMCERCEKTEGEALGHDWQDATCESPKTCSRCDKTKGNALEHSYFENVYDLIWSCMICGEAYVVNEEEFFYANSKTIDECSSVIISVCEEIGLEDVEPNVIGYINSPATFYYYSIRCSNLDKFENVEIYDYIKDKLDSFAVDSNFYELVNITCNNNVYIFDKWHEKLIKNGEYCYNPYTDPDRHVHAEKPYVGMDADYLNDTKLGHYDDLKSSKGPRKVMWYSWSIGGEEIFEATVIDQEVVSISYKENGIWYSEDKSDYK